MNQAIHCDILTDRYLFLMFLYRNENSKKHEIIFAVSFCTYNLISSDHLENPFLKIEIYIVNKRFN